MFCASVHVRVQSEKLRYKSYTTRKNRGAGYYLIVGRYEKLNLVNDIEEVWLKLEIFARE